MIQDILIYLHLNWNYYLDTLITHIKISILSLLIGSIIGIFLGILSAKLIHISSFILNIFSFFRLIPSLGFIMLMIPILGIGYIPALTALILLVIPTMIINTCLGFSAISPSLIEVSKGLGMGPVRRLIKVELPLAFPLIISGIKISAVEIISSATLAAYIGAGGLGMFIVTGIGLADPVLLLIGGISVALLSVLINLILGYVQHVLEFK